MIAYFDNVEWPKLKFGDILENITVRVDPRKIENEIFIGLKHIDSGRVQIKRHSYTKDLIGTKLKFSKGDVIFGKRNAYLRKAAVAEFSGICSAHAMVFRAKKELIIPEFLPFFLHSEEFMSRAKMISEGSISPTIKWKTLSKQEFKIPPLNEQKKILSLFLILENQIERTEDQEKNLLQTKRQLLNELFSDKGDFAGYLTSEDYKLISFGELAQNMSKRVDPSQTDLEIYIGLEHLDPDNLKIERHGVPADVKGTKLLIREGDIIFGKRRAYQRKVAVAHFDGICSAHSMVLRAKDEVVKKEFLPFFMQSDVFMNRAIQISEGSLSPTIKWKVLEKQRFNIPGIEFQDKLIEIFSQFDNLIFKLRDQNESLRKVKHKLLDEIFK